MNAMRRKRLQKALELIEQAQDIISEVKDEEDEAYNNLPESLQESERGEAMSNNVDTLDEVWEELESARDELTEVAE